MFVSKVNITTFKGYRHGINNAGEHVYKFDYPHDEKSEEVKIEFYKLGAKDGDTPIKTINLKDTNTVNFDDIPELSKEDIIAYRVIKDGKSVADSGFYTGDRATAQGFNLISRKVTNPMVQGQAILTIPDIHRPGAFYSDFASRDTGRVNYNINKQIDSEAGIRTVSNSGGGSLAGIEYDIESLSKMGVKKIFMTPIWGGDDRSGHRYWNKNDMQIADSMGNIENYETMLRKLYKNGMQYVDDFAITSEGLEGVHVQYALRWASQNPQSYYWFRLNGLQNGPISLGVVPKNKENLRHRLVNPSVIYNPQTQKIESNPYYNPNKETYFQIYDASQVTQEQLSKKDELITSYKNIHSENKLAINTSEDTIIPYAFEIKPQEYKKRLEEFIKMNKRAVNPLRLDSPEGAIFIGQFTNFKIGEDAEGAVFWDANKDIIKRNYYISGYDEKLINAIPDQAQREKIRELLYRANCEVQDMAIQAGVYRTQLVNDIQTLYTAQILKNASTEAEIDMLIGKGLPKEARLNSEAIENILGGWYNLKRKGIESKDNVTIKALMKLPLDSLELGDNTVGVLSTSYFTNRASDNEHIGLSRYDYYKRNIGIYTPYNTVYYNVDELYETKLKNFAYEVIKTVDRTSAEKLLDAKGNYTEYGEYVVDLLGKDIAKYAFLKAIAGKNLQTKIMPDDVLKGKITYNYPELRKATTLKALGINASSPEEEAKALYKLISDGLNNLDRKDIEYVAKSISKQIDGTNTKSFRLAEAMTNKASLGIDFRLDAAKDIVDIDAVRNGDISFDEAWDKVIDFWSKYVREIKKVNPNTYIVAEITDVDQLMRSIYGQDADVWNMDLSIAGGKYKNVPDAIREFFLRTGITSEASTSYTYTDLLRLFSADAENGDIKKNGIKGLEERINTLINTNNLDYINNLWTFADTHDKPSVLHAMALDMELFHTNSLEADFKNSLEEYENDFYETRRRNARISILQELTNSDSYEALPLEARLNIDNKEYFKAVNPRAVAMSKLMRDAINDRIPDTFNKKAALKQALVDLSNGNYLTNDLNIDLMTIKIPALTSLEEALEEILAKAGIKLTAAEKKAIIEKAKTMLEKYIVRGDFDWNNGSHWAARALQANARAVLGNNETRFNEYSPYTVNLAALLLDSYKEVKGSKDVASFTNGTREFVHKYNRATVEASRQKLPQTISSSKVQKQKAYASRDFETVIDMIIQQAEFKTGKKFTKSEHDYVMKEVFESSTEPAVQKALMYAKFLSALPGIPSIYYRNILGGLGYDEKAKNIFLQNRNTVKYSQIETEGPLKEYRTKIFNEFQEIMRIRNSKGMQAINNGTPYVLKTNNSDVMAMLYQNSDNDAVITVLNASGIDPHNRVVYDEKILKNPINAVYSINSKNKYVPIQAQTELDEIIIPEEFGLTEGMVFVNIYDTDKTEYVIKKIKNGVCYLVRKDGKKIVLNGNTSKLGVMFLKKFKAVQFRGRNLNQQYNILPNYYQKTENHEMGRNLSLLAT